MSDIVDKIAKILNQAERAEEGSPEREAFMERAMSLSAAYSIDLAIARSHTAKKERLEVPETRSFRVGQEGLKANQNAHFVDLMLAICSVHDIEVLIGGGNTYVHGTGMPSDLDLAERLFALLAPQMVAEADKGLKAGDNGEWRDDAPKMKRVAIPDDERAWGEHDGTPGSYGEAFYYDERDEELWDPDRDGVMMRYRSTSNGSGWFKSYPPPRFRLEQVTDEHGNPVFERKWVSVEDARIWRPNFYKGFVHRTQMRLWQAKNDALKDAGIDVANPEDGRALALRDKAKEVKDVFDNDPRTVLATGSYSGAQVSQHAYRGQASGDAAAQRAVHGNEKDLGHG